MSVAKLIADTPFCIDNTSGPWLPSAANFEEESRGQQFGTEGTNSRKGVSAGSKQAAAAASSAKVRPTSKLETDPSRAKCSVYAADGWAAALADSKRSAETWKLRAGSFLGDEFETFRSTSAPDRDIKLEPKATAAARIGGALNLHVEEGHQAVKGGRGGTSKSAGMSWNRAKIKLTAQNQVGGKVTPLGEAAQKNCEVPAKLARPSNFLVVGDHKGLKVSERSFSSRFKGVCWHRECSKWAVSISVNGMPINLGLFGDEEEAARKYDEVAGKLGRPLNFPGKGDGIDKSNPKRKLTNTNSSVNTTKAPKLSTNRVRSTRRSFYFFVGQKVSARFEGGDTWYESSIGADNGDGTYRVCYADGDVEERVEGPLIRPIF
mmetsp:Transcript_8426/g.19171  ORF Transcript_8426/g.19171 Transcript_8426/m.19171 type:complete len:377 (-) Transcript_8426:445-1575(-)